jgi:GR25 family glycosyltransferase involved in LPS biosynthesis
MSSAFRIAGLIFIALAIITTFVLLSVCRTHDLRLDNVAAYMLPHKVFQFVSDKTKVDCNRQIGMVAYYINLHRSEHRRKFMETQKKKLNCFCLKRMPGVDGSKFDNMVTSKRSDNDLVPFDNIGFDFHSKGELGATLSHLKVILDAYHSGVSNVLVLEDDTSLNFVPFWKKTLPDLLASAPKGCKILRIYHHEFPGDEPSDFAQMSKHPEDGPLRWGAVAYVVTREGMEDILKKTWVQEDEDEVTGYPIGKFVLKKSSDLPRGQADYLIFDAVGLDNVYTYRYSQVYPDNFEDNMNSTLHEKHTAQHLEVSRRIFTQFIGA